MKRQSLTKTRFDLNRKGILRNFLCNLVENTISQKVSAQNKRKLSKQENLKKLKWGNKRDRKTAPLVKLVESNKQPLQKAQANYTKFPLNS